jgi:predicted metalloprotease with PDZ domain
MGLGQEHHESSDDRIDENGPSDPNKRLLNADLFPHEFTHSWNGQYRRPEGLATKDFQQPMKGNMLWAYEGLTSYLGFVLATRSGLLNEGQAREQLASLASTLEHRAGRNWRSLENTSRAAQILYFAPSEWVSYRRSTDFYGESVLIWLEADVTIRKLSRGTKSLDDFCRSFLGGSDTAPAVKPYTFDDLVRALNDVAAYDWGAFFRERLDSTGPDAPLGGITEGGWRLQYSDDPNEIISASQAANGQGDYSSSIGLIVKSDGMVQDVIPGMPAYAGAISPYTRIIGVNGRQFSIDQLTRLIKESTRDTAPMLLVVSSGGRIENHKVVYHEGLRMPHLVRNGGVHDYLSDIVKPKAAQ